MTIKKIALTLSLLATFVASAANHPLQIAGADRTKVGIYIEDLRSGFVLADINADTPMVPASVTKALTSATAYSQFSPQGRFVTPVTINGDIKKGVLEGDVIISTIGDPTVESAHFPDNQGFADSIAAALKMLDIKQIKGTVLLDESNFVDGTIPQGWLSEDLMHPYGAGVFASNYRDNRMSVSLPSKRITPETPGVSFKMLGGKGAPRLSRERDSKVFTVSGRLGRRGVNSTVANPDPGSSMRAETMRAIRNAGISIAEKPYNPKGKKGTTIYQHTSPTVAEILQSLMFRSDNMMAEGMLRSLAPGENRAGAIKAERDFWLSKGLDLSKLNIVDGSGLSRDDSMTPRFMANMLKLMARGDLVGGFVNIFPRAGQEGTMRNFLKDTPLEGRLATKTGSMKGVQTYGGYLLDDNGYPTHVVVVFVNGFTCSRDALRNEISKFLLDKLAPQQ